MQKRKLKKKKLRLHKPEKKVQFEEEVAKLLPSSISEIKVQKKNSTRFSLFVDNQFLVGVSDSTLSKLNLRIGSTITSDLLKDILQKENYWAIKEYCIRLLGRRDHARNELKVKARKKGFSLAEIENVLDELSQKNYINNASFAKKFARDKFKFNKWGANKIRIELIKKSIPEKDIQTALSEIPISDQIESIKKLVIKNKRNFLRAEPFKRKKKIFDFLLRKGYDSNTILKEMTTLLELIPE